MTGTRKRRGRDTERLTAAYWRTRGFPYCEAVGAGTPGRDLTGTGPVAVEIKGRASFDPLLWVRQATRHKTRDDDLPCVILRCNGQGPETIADWPVMLPHSVFLRLLGEAGYAAVAE